MRVSINSVRPQDIDVYDAGWGDDRPEGIRFGNVDIWLSDAALDQLSVVVSMLQTERAQRDAERERDETRECEEQAGAYTVGLPKWRAS